MYKVKHKLLPLQLLTHCNQIDNIHIQYTNNFRQGEFSLFLRKNYIEI